MSSLPSPSPGAPAVERRHRRALRLALRWTAVLIFAAWSLVLIAWLTLHWGILPRLGDWRPQIEAHASAALGTPTRIGAIRVHSSGWVPSFELIDVQLLDREGRVGLHLARVLAALSPSSLLALEPRFAQLLVDDVSLDIRRDRDGRFFVAGLDLDSGATAPADPAGIDWFFAQHEIVIRHGTVRWTDEQRAAPPLALTAVNLVLRNRARGHEVRLDATPPADWGAPFTLRGRFTQPRRARAGDWNQWSGEVFAELPGADVSQLRRHVDLPFDLDKGRGALRAWAVLDRGVVAQTTVDLALAEVSLRLAPALPALVLEQVAGRFQARYAAGRQGLDVEGLSFVTDDGVRWAPSTLRLGVERDGAQGAISAGRLSLDALDLAATARLAARLPLGAPLHAWLDALKPVGQVSDLVASWRGALDAPTSYEVSARARRFGLAAGPAGPAAVRGESAAGRPGLSGADIELQATDKGGRARLAMEDGSLVFPGVFAEPVLPMRQLDARVEWRRQPGATPQAPARIEVAVHDARIRNDDVQGQLNGRWHTGPGEGFGEGQRFPGVLEIAGRIDHGDAARVVRYLPLGVPAAARGYVQRAVLGGRITAGTIDIRGDFWNFPYVEKGPGVFRIGARAEGVTLAYLPSEADWVSPWPVMTNVTGEIEFDRAAMRLRDVSALTAGVPLRAVRGGIADMAHEGVLRLDGQTRAPLSDMLRFVNATPVGDWLGAALREATGSGNADLTLSLQIPIGDAARSAVRGAVQFAGNDIRLRPGTPLLGGARGRVDFTHQGLQIVGARARVLGGDATFEGGTQADGTLRFSGQGLATVEGLLQAGELPALAPLAALGPRLRGQAPYRVQLGFPQGRTDLLVTSSLAGIAADLPAPLAKPASASWPLRLQIQPQPGQPQFDLLQLAIGDTLKARYERDLSGPTLRVARGALGVGADAPVLPAAGVAATLRLGRVDADAWRDVGERMAAQPGVDVGAVPDRIALSADELRAGARKLTGVVLDLRNLGAAQGSHWQALGRADQAEGSVELRLPGAGAGPGKVTARLKRLALPDVQGGGVEELLEQAPTSVPALDIVVDDFEWRGRALGQLEVQALNQASATRQGTREWRLDRLRLHSPQAELNATGLWSTGRRMQLDFGLDLVDSGAFAELMGAGAALRGGKGRIDGQLHWAGSPLVPDTASLGGEFKIALEEGRFLNAEAGGAAKLLGVLSLQALPRRLLLDFRDVFQQGFAFDRVNGDVVVERGVARTNNLRIVGVQAAVLIEGRADLRQETQDLSVVAVPEINAGTASLAYAAINPAIGLGTFVAQWLLREPLMAAGTREFRITGGWSDPKVERVERVERGATKPEGSRP